MHLQSVQYRASEWVMCIINQVVQQELTFGIQE